jgi:hypothetical protein
MKRTALLIIALLAGLAVSHAQMDLRLEWSSGNAFWADTVYATSVKVPLQNVGHGVFGLQIVNRGKLGLGSGWLYAGLIGRSRADTSIVPASNWQRAVRIYPAATGSLDVNYWLIPKCVADTLWLKSTDSVSVDVYQW